MADDRMGTFPLWLDTEPSHHCPGCDQSLWSVVTGDVPCPFCADDAYEIQYCPECDRPDCTIGAHQ